MKRVIREERSKHTMTSANDQVRSLFIGLYDLTSPPTLSFIIFFVELLQSSAGGMYVSKSDEEQSEDLPGNTIT